MTPEEALANLTKMFDDHNEDLKNVTILDKQIDAHKTTIDIFKG